jgi:hypothetical protein
MPTLDYFVRGAGETSPFNLVNHTPDAGGSWSIHTGGNFIVSPNNYARLSNSSTLSIAQWTGDTGIDNYEAAVEGFWRSAPESSVIAVCTRLESGAGVMHRMYVSGANFALDILDAFGGYTGRAALPNAGAVKTDNPYLVVGTCNGTTFTTSVKDLVSSLWLTSAGTFTSSARVAALTATITHSSARGRIGIHDYAGATDTTGSSFDAVSYGEVGTLGATLPPTAITLTGPTSGTVGQASTNFTIGTDNPVQSGSVVVTPSDGGDGGTFTPTTVTLTSSTATATFTYTAATSGTKTISVTNNASLTNPSSISYTASAPAPVTTYTLTGPSTCTVGQASSNFTATLGTGVLTGTVVITPSAGAGGGTFSPSSVSLTNTTRSATFTYTAASAGSKTIATTNDGGLTNPASLSVTASTNQTIYCDNAAIVKSPTNWVLSGSTGAQAAETVWPGSYMRLRFDGTAININVSTAGLSAYPWVLYQVDSLNPVIAKLTAGQTAISITGLSAGAHELNVIYQARDDYNQAGTWGDAQKLQIVSFVPSGGTGLLAAPAARPKRAIIYGDSITAGLAVTAPPGVTTAVGVNAATASYANHIGVGLNAEFDQAGCGADGWTVGGVGGFPALPSGWNLKKPGVPRSLAAHDYVVVIHGYNDGATDIASSVVTNWITAVRATTAAWIFICVPFSGRQRGAITAGVASYIAANPSEAKVKVIDLGSFYQSAQSGYYTTDGIHPNSWQGGRLAAAYVGGMVQHIGTGAAVAAPTYRGGFRRV